jgi:crotonobetainyl-CoA:carnitine CoA-transferase CaiB-like acyl-CoA transferase
MVQEIDDPINGRTLHPGIVPQAPGDESGIRWPGPAIGAHTEEVLRELAGTGGERPGYVPTSSARSGAAPRSSQFQRQSRAST